MILELTISGPIPAKKNQIRVKRGSHAYYDSQTKAAMLDMREQLTSQWLEDAKLSGTPMRVPRPPLGHCAMACVFYVSKRGTRADRDGKWTTVVDELVNVGVLKDDCIDDWNGPVLLTSAIVTDGFAGARIFIEPAGHFQALWDHIRVLDMGGWRPPKPPNRFRRLAARTRAPR